jgi:hypothetical protein
MRTTETMEPKFVNRVSGENGWSGDNDHRGFKQLVDPDKLKQFTNTDNAKASCHLYLDHIKNTICGNYIGEQKDKSFDYIIKWMASSISEPLDDKETTALVLYSSMAGTGKGSFVRLFGQLFGSYFFHLTDSSRLDNRFNSLMRDRLLCYVDENLFAGDKTMQAILKGIQTENTFIVESKEINVEIVSNHCRFIYARTGNSGYKKNGGDRRFVVIDVPNKKMNGEKYNAMASQWANSGKEGFYYYLMSDEMQESIKHFDFKAGITSSS